MSSHEPDEATRVALHARTCGERRRTSVSFAVVGAALLKRRCIRGCGERAARAHVPMGDSTDQRAARRPAARQGAAISARGPGARRDEGRAGRPQAEADSAQGAARQKLQGQVRLLEEKWSVAEAKLAALRAQTAQAWAAMQEQVVVALVDLKQSYQEIRREMAQS